ncbi:MAG: DNA polymerase III subunit beta [Synergistaceae bacterium]|nr:DNA polymerase III subunit beta [Synergistaceae bacterium]
MKLQIKRQDFLKSWQIAEKITNAKSTIEGVRAVLIKADEDGTVTLEATDMKSYVRSKAEGVTVVEPGLALANAAILGSMMKKYSSDDLELEFSRERGLLVSGSSKIRVAGIARESFPGVPDSKDAELVCEIMASDLARIISEGSSASSMPQDFPRYMGTCLLRTEDQVLKVISTDGRRLSRSKTFCTTMSNRDLLLSAPAVKELGKTIASYGEAQVSILAESSMVWFRLENVEFAIRLIDSNFPNYERILNDEKHTVMRINCADLSIALDRVDIIAKNTPAHIMAMAIQPTGEIRITARAPEVGTAAETVFANVEGSYIQLGFNVGYFQDGLKALGQGDIVIEFSGEEEQARMYRDGSQDFLYMLMPARLTMQDAMTEEEIGDFSNHRDEQDYQPEPESPEQNYSEQENSEQNNFGQENNY